MLRTSSPQRLFARALTHTQTRSVSCARLKDKVALVTASTDGIGLAIARRLAQEGAKVLISSRKQTSVDRALQLLAPEGDVRGRVCHVGERDQRVALLEACLEEFGQLDVLVSNAAVSPAIGPFLDTSEDQFDKILSINVKSAFLLTQEALPLLQKSESASIVYVSSIGAYQSFPLIAAYCVSKTALLGLARATALQCAPSIRANVVCPGVIRTRFSEALWKNESAREELNRMVPLQRVGEPEEVAALVAFLASQDASYVTGESFVVAGGQFSRL